MGKNREKDINYGYLSKLDVSQIDDMSNLFQDFDFIKYNDDKYTIKDWNISNLKYMRNMFHSAKFNENDNFLEEWKFEKLENIEAIFANSNFNQNISNWNVSNVKNMSYMFYNCKNFNQNISNWDVSNVKNMSYMFF